MSTIRVCNAVRLCPRGRRAHRPPTLAPKREREERVTEQGNRIDVEVIRGFLKRALADDALADAVNELLFEHVVDGRYHSTVLAATLPAYIREILDAATCSDWQAVADELIAEAREMDGEV